MVATDERSVRWQGTARARQHLTLKPEGARIEINRFIQHQAVGPNLRPMTIDVVVMCSMVMVHVTVVFMTMLCAIV